MSLQGRERIDQGTRVLEDSDKERRPQRGAWGDINASPVDPLVPIKPGSERTDFLMDSGATHWVATGCKGPLSKTAIPTLGATAKSSVAILATSGVQLEALS